VAFKNRAKFHRKLNWLMSRSTVESWPRILSEAHSAMAKATVAYAAAVRSETVAHRAIVTRQAVLREAVVRTNYGNGSGHDGGGNGGAAAAHGYTQASGGSETHLPERPATDAAALGSIVALGSELGDIDTYLGMLTLAASD
jgi:hypothetical protein